MSESPEVSELLQKLDEMVESLEAHHQTKAPAIREQFDAIVEGLKTQRALLVDAFAQADATTDKSLSAAKKIRAAAQRELEASKTAGKEAVKTVAKVASPVAKTDSIDPKLGARMRRELLEFLGESSPQAAPRTQPASFTQWAMTSTSLGRLSQTQPPANAPVRLGPVIGGLSDRRLIWWACVSIAEAMRLGNRQLPPDELAALESATRWVLTPSPAAQSEMAKMAGNLKEGAIGQALAQAVAVADREATGKSAGSAALAAERAAAALLPEAQWPAYASRCKEIAAAVADGRALWPNIAASPEKKPSGDFQAWLSQTAR